MESRRAILQTHSFLSIQASWSIKHERQFFVNFYTTFIFSFYLKICNSTILHAYDNLQIYCCIQVAFYVEKQKVLNLTKNMQYAQSSAQNLCNLMLISMHFYHINAFKRC